jgi:hypothetical protein
MKVADNAVSARSTEIILVSTSFIAGTTIHSIANRGRVATAARERGNPVLSFTQWFGQVGVLGVFALGLAE